MPSPILFGHTAIDRAAHLRNDAEAQARMRAAKEARVMALWNGNVLVDEAPEIAWLSFDEVAETSRDAQPLFLGLQDGQPRYAVQISDWDEIFNNPGFFDEGRVSHPAYPAHFSFRDLRSLMFGLPATALGDAATAKSMLHWQKTHSFCGHCGGKNRHTHAGWHSRCFSCDRMGFPHIEPVVIMLVTRGNKTLLGRSHGWPEGVYSLLAGFMEPGETIAEAVRREVFEESGVRIGKVKVLDDQPWPFPGSLMIGCYAEALSENINLDPIELEAAQWVSRERVLETLDGSDPAFQPARKGAIARNLLDRWLADCI